MASQLLENTFVSELGLPWTSYIFDLEILTFLTISDGIDLFVTLALGAAIK